MEARIDRLTEEGLARRHGQHVIFARNLLATLRRRELDDAAANLSAEIGLAHQPVAEGELVSGVYRQRVTLASGRFAMIDDGLGFQLVPWRPALERDEFQTNRLNRRPDSLGTAAKTADFADRRLGRASRGQNAYKFAALIGPALRAELPKNSP
jgi:hypothetical protein